MNDDEPIGGHDLPDDVTRLISQLVDHLEEQRKLKQGRTPLYWHLVLVCEQHAGEPLP